MKNFIIKIHVFFKGIILLLKPHVFLSWLRHPFLTTYNMLGLSKWISENSSPFNDFYTGTRDHNRRYNLYQHVIDTFNVNNQEFAYLEFGVSHAFSFKWWLKACDNPNAKFYGFDTFEGLPESWGVFAKGAMMASIPDVDDARASFFKGLFQETLPDFIKSNFVRPEQIKIIHLDADLFSSTLFVLTTLSPILKKGDILIFDEFNVPNHEYYALKLFCDTYYVKVKLVGAVNNYYQIALEIV